MSADYPVIACLGAGRMGRGIAVAFAYAGHAVVLTIEMLLRMYLHWAQKNDYAAEILDRQDDGVAGQPPLTSDALGGAILATDTEIFLDHVIVRNNEARGGKGADGVAGRARCQPEPLRSATLSPVSTSLCTGRTPARRTIPPQNGDIFFVAGLPRGE